MLERLLKVYRKQNPNVMVRAAALWDDEETGYRGSGVYVAPAKLLLVVTEEDHVIIKRFTPDKEYAPKNITGLPLKISGKPGKNVVLKLKGADAYYDSRYHGDDAPEKRSLRSRLKDGGIVLDSTYKFEQCDPGDAFPDEKTFFQFLTEKRR